MREKNSKEVIINGHKLLCPICGGSTFWENKETNNGRWAYFFNLPHKKFDNFICQQCGYISCFWNE